MKKYLPLLILLTILLVAGGLKSALFPSKYHPFYVMDIPGGLRVTYLQEGLTEDECESTLTAVLNTAQTSCPTCVPLKRNCQVGLTERQTKWLSTDALDVPSLRWVDGVILFESEDAALAQLACRQHALNSIARDGTPQARCYAPNLSRKPVQRGYSQILQRKGMAIALGISLVLLALGAWLAQADSSNHLGQFLYSRSRRDKKLIIIASDLVSLETALWLSFSLRLEQIYQPRGDAFLLFVLAPLIAFPIFVKLGLYRTIIRYIGVPAIIATAKAVLIYSGLLILFQFLLELEDVPRSVPFINALLALAFIASSRVIARYWGERSSLFGLNQGNHGQAERPEKVIIYGAGEAGVQLASALAIGQEMAPLGFVDDDPTLHGHVVSGFMVHPPSALPNLIEVNEVKNILLAIPHVSRARRNEIIRSLESLPVHVKTIPRLTELAQGKINTDDLREIDIEDLLGRDPVPPDAKLMSENITGKTVMVTGAGGSIGSELCRQILAMHPRHLVLFELNEFALYSIEQELLLLKAALGEASLITPILGSVTLAHRVRQTITSFGVETIFHAAAYKHVPMVEKNPTEGVYNNIIGTYTTAHVAHECKVGTFVLISTDKAVRPTNTMGASKRFAELILQACASHYPQQTRYTIVRFGNVLGSSGSVVPLFRKQIRSGGPITVTDPRIIRYFMTIPEAAQLVIQAGSMGNDGDVFVLDMAEPVKILDVARRMISLSGLRERNQDHPSGDIEIVFTGLRPGEKLYEELLIGDNVTTTPHPRIMRANEKSLPWQQVQALLQELREACIAGDSTTIREILLRSVDGYVPQCGNEDLLLSQASITTG